MARKQPPVATPSNLPPEKAYAVLTEQLKKLKALNGRNYQDAHVEEDEWQQLTEKLVIRSFGSDSPNHDSFRSAMFAGEHSIRLYGNGPDHQQEQRNFEERQQRCASTLRSCLAELELDLPDNGPKGVYEPGEEYEYYRDVAAILKLAQNELFIADPYLSKEIFEVYAGAISRNVRFRLLGSNIPADVQALAAKYASGGNFEFRRSSSFHDRVIFADNRVWLSGQSIKDAARKKPTYIVEHDEAPMRPIYERIWDAASKVM